ncbi:MAG: PAS domain-containing protein [Tepidisphaeraceae bacterium]
MPRSPRSLLTASLVVIGTVAAAVGLRAGLSGVLGTGSPLILFLLPVVVSAWLGGWVAGVCAAVLGAIIGIGMFAPEPNDHETMVAFWMRRTTPFVVVSAAIALFADAMNRARLQAGQAMNELAESRRRRDAALLLGEVGTYYWDLQTDRVQGDRNFVPLFGVELDADGAAPLARFIDQIHEDDRDRVSHQIEATLRSGQPFQSEYRIRHPSGLKWLVARGSIEKDADGQPVGWGGVVIDVTARRRAEVALADSEHQFRTLFNSMDAGYCIIEMLYDPAGRPADYRFLVANPAFEKQTGLSEVVGRTMLEMVPNHDDHWFEIYGRVAETGEPIRFVEEAQSMGGLWFDLYAFRVGGAESRRVAVLFTNITARRRNEIELKETAKQRDALIDLQRAVAHQSGRGETAVIADAADRVLPIVPDADGSAIEMLESTTEDGDFLVYRATSGLLTKFVGMRVHRANSLSGLCLTQATALVCDDTETDPRVDRESCRKAGIRSMIVVPILRGGTMAGVLKFSSARPKAFDEADVLAAQLAVGAIATGLSSAAEARAIEALRRSEQQFRLIADAMPQFVWVTDATGYHEYLNRRWYEYVGSQFSDNHGYGWAVALHPEDADRARKRWGQSLDTGEPYEIEYRFRRHDGVYRWFLGRALAVRDADGRIVKWYGTCTDIEEHKRLQQQYDAVLASERAARSAAELAGRMKDDFLATISHELRTPLSAIVGWSHLLTPETDKAALTEGLAVIHRNAQTQSQLIEDILDVSRITSGRMRLKTQRLNACDPVRAAVSTVRTAADAKGVQLVIDLPDHTDLIADADRLQQIFWNLLANAIKFTDKGGRVSVVGRTENQHAVFDVIDTGRGIEPEFLPYVFERFRQADMTTTRRHGGLGLGLAIVRHLVELHGGRVSAHSTGRGQGCTFRVELPFGNIDSSPSAPAASAMHAPRDMLVGRRILVIDDEPDARRVLEAMLGRNGVEIVLADSVREAMEKLASGAAFDAVVSDIGMPNEDGYVFVRQLRQAETERGRRRLPAIALTAYTRTSDRNSVLEAGFDRYLSKPVNPDDLFGTLNDLLKPATNYQI